MGGLLFGTSFYLNIKCLIFSLAIIFIYYLPHPNTTAHEIVMIFLLGMSAYISMAWYDFLYRCDEILQPTLLGYISSPFKPKEYTEQYNKLPLKNKKIIRNFDIRVLIIIVITFLYPFFINKK
jgi:hypothetical protein